MFSLDSRFSYKNYVEKSKIKYKMNEYLIKTQQFLYTDGFIILHRIYWYMH